MYQQSPNIVITPEEFLELWTPVIKNNHYAEFLKISLVEPVGYDYEGRTTIRIKPTMDYLQDADEYCVEISTELNQPESGFTIDRVIINYEGDDMTFYEEGLSWDNNMVSTLASIDYLHDLIKKLF